ncbi:MAG: hypothetical protein ACXADC_06050 [Candidatus Thorarchaeota archaeon]
MELEAIKGRNQRGISYVHPSLTVIKTARLSYQGKEVYTDIRTSERIASGSIVIDLRIFNELGCDEHSEISMMAIPEEIPTCNEITFLVASLEGLENDKIVKAVSNRIEDLKKDLDGLILGVGQQIQVADLGLRLIVDSVQPLAPQTQVSRISWNRLLKVNFSALEELPSCFNICIAIDVGASSLVEDVRTNDGSLSRTRFETGLSAIKAILSSARECPGALVSAIAFSESSYRMETGEGRALMLNSKSYQRIHDWLSSMNDEQGDEPSNPGGALNLSHEMANEMESLNGLPTVVLLISGGAFTSGRNPVSIARTIGANDGISISSIALGSDSDLELMRAIADAGNGRLIHIGKFEEVILVVEKIFDRFRIEAAGK